jgi:hypothetical protein
MEIVRLVEEHWPDIAAIYAEGIATGHATFDAQPPTWADFDASHLAGHGRVAVATMGRSWAGWPRPPCQTAASIPGGAMLWSNARNRFCLRPRHLA